jgi:uncharacterized protein
MFELPLFPLNTVLFPGMPLELHIFEERYKLMINKCLDKHKPFGVVLIRHGRAEQDSLAESYSVGCTAHITQMNPLDEGRMNIVAIGHERFRILSVKRDQPYLTGMVENYPLREEKAPDVLPLSQKLRPLLKQFLQVMDKAGQVQFRSQRLPQNPIALAYLAAVLLQIPNVQQQALLSSMISSERPIVNRSGNWRTFITQQQLLLEADQAARFIQDLCTIYSREVALLDFINQQQDKDNQSNPFSWN